MPFGDPYAGKPVDALAAPKPTVGEKRGKPVVTEIKDETTTSAPPAGNMSAGKIWGTVVRKLRADRNIVLWVACQDMTASLSGNTLVIAANDEPGYNAVIKEQNLQTLTATVRSVGNYNVKVVLAKDDKKDDFEEGVAAIKRNTGVSDVKIKD